jgi:hypothetical protein
MNCGEIRHIHPGVRDGIKLADHDAMPTIHAICRIYDHRWLAFPLIFEYVQADFHTDPTAVALFKVEFD